MSTKPLPNIGLRRLCQPRQSVFDRAKADTVDNIADFNAGRIEADTFFAENHVTEGMKVLLRQVFERLSGSSDQGVFRLKQAMGGGKTHNMIAAGLLAGSPRQRQGVLAQLGLSVDRAPVQVAAFDGRETDTKDFLWIHLLKQLKRQHLWEGSLGDAPGPSTWARLIGEEPTLIMLDEMPPFFVALGGRSAGPSTTQADILAVALANLMAAIMTNKLPRCCLVISDLAGVWALGSAHIQQAIDNASNEINRVATDIVPVRMDGLELYGVLRARLFSRLPDRDSIAHVSQAYAAAYRTAVQQSAMPMLYERWAAEIMDTYPFHPGMQELFARFRENPGFQQTRETLRLARRMVAGIWEDRGHELALIHPHDVDFNDRDVDTMLDRINPSLRNACARDVAARGTATAEALARKGGDPAPVDAARLLYLSSLAISANPNALHGLTPEEVAAYLCAPGRDVSRINAALLTQIEDASWYLHRRTDGRWYYRDVKNVNSAIKDRAQTLNEDARRKEVEAYLRNVFKPGKANECQTGSGRLAYQRLLVFPTTDDIQGTISADDMLLVISQPHAQGLNPILRTFWDNQTFKNRLMFLCGGEVFSKVSENAAYVKAAEDQIKEFEAQRMPDTAPEMQQAKSALDRWRGGFLSALRETFTVLHYPGLDGSLCSRSLKLEFASNAFVGETAILDTLKDERKYRNDVESDSFRDEFEQEIFTAVTMQWRDLTETVARRADWYLVPPGGHETLKAAALRKDLWRDEGAGYVRKGPFPPEKTAVVLQQLARDDDTGKATLQVSAKHGDCVHFETGGSPASPSSPVVEGGRLETDEMRVSLLAVDSTGVHETGEPRPWQNTVTLKYQRSYRDGATRITLKASPRGAIRYTLDGSNPRYGGIYDGEIEVPDGRELLLAMAEASGIWSELLHVDIPRVKEGDGDSVAIDPARPAEWRHRLKCPDRRRTFEVLAILKRLGGEIGGAQINASLPNSTEDWINLSFGRNLAKPAEDIEKLATELAGRLGQDPQPDLDLNISRLMFATGQALIEAAKELGETLRPDEVKQ
ncbi:DUF499 domain-containing protein [Accumulibacter sp.]|uniref:DUF499 domain-containing protein n=1 Tax=Accumulibacter sp. TaxID=2053492 RepID=UPI0025F57EA9|nr:DUF499 domain-containing protein [Accumulibacter sp.]MCM8594871.1 DUF499 domain-containing protein [Accumulibacter sp.]MDS4049017.1 DUF499 domain-containing protein [Accumulibacter sp.]